MESVPYSNQYWVCRPFGITVPFRTALLSDILVGRSVVTSGGEPELLFPPPPPPPLQVVRKMQIVGRNIMENKYFQRDDLWFMTYSRDRIYQLFYHTSR
jgi:hypothetical protein